MRRSIKVALLVLCVFISTTYGLEGQQRARFAPFDLIQLTTSLAILIATIITVSSPSKIGAAKNTKLLMR